MTMLREVMWSFLRTWWVRLPFTNRHRQVSQSTSRIAICHRFHSSLKTEYHPSMVWSHQQAQRGYKSWLWPAQSQENSHQIAVKWEKVRYLELVIHPLLSLWVHKSRNCKWNKTTWNISIRLTKLNVNISMSWSTRRQTRISISCSKCTGMKRMTGTQPLLLAVEHSKPWQLKR